MVDPILFSAVVGLLTKGIPAAVTNLKVRYEQTKATKEETMELEEFLRDLHDCATQYRNNYGGALNATATTTTTSTMSSFAKKLEDAQKTLDQWSSQHAGFFSRSPGERLRKLQALRKKVDRAVIIESFRMTASILGHMRNFERVLAQNWQTPTVSGSLHPKTTKNVSTPVRSISAGKARTSSSTRHTGGNSRSISVERDRHDPSDAVEKRPLPSKFEVPNVSQLIQERSIKTTENVSTPIMSITTGQASISSTLHPTTSSSSSISVERDRHDSSYQVESSSSVSVERDRHNSSHQVESSSSISVERDRHNSSHQVESSSSISVERDRRDSSHQVEKIRTIELWAQFDSEKQSNAIEIKLKGLRDVKHVFFNPEKRQVRVELREGSKVGTHKLIDEIKLALPKEKRATPPRLWSDR